MAAPTFVAISAGVGVASGTSTISPAPPTGVASGDHQLVFIALFNTTTSITAPSGWTLVGVQSNTSSGTPFRLHCFRTTTHTGTQAFTKGTAAPAVAVRVAYRGGEGFASFNGSQNSATTNHTLGSVTTTIADSMVIAILAEGTSSSSTINHTAPAGWNTERIDYSSGTGIGRNGMLALYDIVKASPGSQGGTIGAATSGHSATMTVVLSGSSVVVPTVGAGADVTGHAVSTEFTRNATEDDNGAAITSREWEITAGPAGVGTTIGTDSSLAWTPSVAGAYTLTYSATNSAGAGSDSMTIEVITPTAPTVDAGADVASHTVSTLFQRTATEDANGATITSREWTIDSGPAGVGTTIGTAAALNWTPSVTGTYVLEYAATNSVGTDTDTVSVTVVAAPSVAVVRARSSGVIGTGTTTHSITLPSGIVAGDSLLVWFVNDEQADPTSAVPNGASIADGWVSLLSVKQGTSTNHRATLFHLPLAEGGGADALTVTITGNHESAYICFAIDNAGTPVITNLSSGNSTGQTVPTHTGLELGDYLSLVLLGLDQNPAADQTIGVPSGYTDLVQAEATVGTGAVSAFSMERTFQDVTSITPGAMTWTSNEQSLIFHVAVPAAEAPTVPTVGAGADVSSHPISTLFSRTATEDANGSAITDRSWMITSGPVGVGSEIGTAAALSWTPTTAGTYVLEYVATNAIGIGADSMQIVVIPAPQPPGSGFDLDDWKLTTSFEDPSDPGDADEVLQPELDTYIDEYFYLDTLSHMVMIAPVVGETTGGSSGTRCEFREMEDGDEADWTIASSGYRRLTVTGAFDPTSITGGTTPRKEMIVGQIHGLTGTPPLYLAVEHHVDPPRLRVYKDGPGVSSPLTGLTATTVITYRIEVNDGRVKVWCIIGEVADLPTEPNGGDWAAAEFSDNTGCYLKAGAYNKTEVASGSTGEARATIQFFELIQPGDEVPVLPSSSFLTFFDA